MPRTSSDLKTSSKLEVNLASQSRIKYFTGWTRCSRAMAVSSTAGPPRSRGMSGGPGYVHLSGVEFDEEQHVETPGQHRIDGEEVAGQQRCRLGAEKLSPGRTIARR